MTNEHRSTSTPNPPDGAVTPDLLAQLADTLWLPHDLSKAQRAARIAAAQAQLADMAPGDGIEAMLAVQMIATHEASMSCLQRATRGDQSPELCDQNLKHAERLLALYARQMEVLGRHRLRDQQLTEREDKGQQDRGQRDAALEPLILTEYVIDPDGTRTLDTVTVCLTAPDGTMTYEEKIFPEEPAAAEKHAAQARATP
jgi:hypothetical protein